MERTQKILVIGAGPAGSMAAILLARAGQHVTLIEQSRFPRDKVCGECLSALGRSVLSRHGLESALLLAGGVELTHADLIAPDTRTRLDLPAPMLGISRAVLDQLLLDEAVRCGVLLRQPCRAESIDNQTVRLRDLMTNTIESCAADCVLIADGRGALLGSKPAPSGDLGIKAHFQNVAADPQAITLYAVDGCYGGAAPIEANRWNVAFSVPAAQVGQAHGDVASVFRQWIASNAVLRKHFEKAVRQTDWLASPLPRFAVQQDWPARVIPLGNAAAAIEPIGGEGMGLALRSAELAAEAILAGTTDRLPTAYQSLWTKRRLFCRLGARLLSHPTSAHLSIDLLHSIPFPQHALLTLIGK